MTLWQDFSTHTGKLMHKRASYFPVYERHFSRFCNKSMTFLEIGVARGGSARLWSRYFGPMAKIVGVDIEENPRIHPHPMPGSRNVARCPEFLCRERLSQIEAFCWRTKL